MDKKTKEKDTDTSINTEAVSAILKNSLNDNIRCGYSLNDSVLKTIDEVSKIAKNSKPIQNTIKVKDNFGNTLSSIGTNDKVQSFNNYGFDNSTLNYPLWTALYNDSWVFKRAIDKPAIDEVNAGFTLHGEEDYTVVYDAYDKYKQDLLKILKWGALYGGAIGVILFEGFEDADYSKPLQKERIVGKRFQIYVTDRWYGCSQSMKTVNSMRNIDYGKPESYNVSFANGKLLTIHHDFVLRYEHRDAPRLIKMGMLQGWGYAEGSHILNELSRDDQLKSSITSLVNKSLIEVIKMKGMRAVFMGADSGSVNQLQKRLEMVQWARTFNSLTLLDKDDDYQQHQMSAIGGLSDLLEKNMWLIAAALEMQGVLFGDLKGGLSQESDAFKRYAITIKNRCDALFRPVLYKFLKIVCCVNEIQGPIKFEFNSLIKNDENNDKVKSIRDLSETLKGLFDIGIISKYQFALTVKDFINNNVINLNISDEQLNKLKLEEQDAILQTISQFGKANKIELEQPQFNIPYRKASEISQVGNENNKQQHFNTSTYNKIEENNEQEENNGESNGENPEQLPNE